jgi:hypothetical protein
MQPLKLDSLSPTLLFALVATSANLAPIAVIVVIIGVFALISVSYVVIGMKAVSKLPVETSSSLQEANWYGNLNAESSLKHTPYVWKNEAHTADDQ